MTLQEKRIIEKQRELKVTDFLKGKFKYDNYGQYIWLVESNGNHQKIADIRGWGRIQHLFMDKNGKLDEKKAGEFQDKCGQWVADTLNKALESQEELKPTDEEILLKFAEFNDAMKKIYDLYDNKLVVNKYLNSISNGKTEE